MNWLTNGYGDDINHYTKAIKGKPKASKAYTEEQLIAMDIYGIYGDEKTRHYNTEAIFVNADK